MFETTVVSTMVSGVRTLAATDITGDGVFDVLSASWDDSTLAM